MKRRIKAGSVNAQDIILKFFSNLAVLSEAFYIFLKLYPKFFYVGLKFCANAPWNLPSFPSDHT